MTLVNLIESVKECPSSDTVIVSFGDDVAVAYTTEYTVQKEGVEPRTGIASHMVTGLASGTRKEWIFLGNEVGTDEKVSFGHEAHGAVSHYQRQMAKDTFSEYFSTAYRIENAMGKDFTPTPRWKSISQLVTYGAGILAAPVTGVLALATHLPASLLEKHIAPRIESQFLQKGIQALYTPANIFTITTWASVMSSGNIGHVIDQIRNPEKGNFSAVDTSLLSDKPSENSVALEFYTGTQFIGLSASPNLFDKSVMILPNGYAHDSRERCISLRPSERDRMKKRFSKAKYFIDLEGDLLKEVQKHSLRMDRYYEKVERVNELSTLENVEEVLHYVGMK